MSEEVLQLVGKIRKASQAYYDGEPIMSDGAFDQLVGRLVILDPENEILHQTGYGYVPAGHLKKFRHVKTVGSLDKIKHGEIRESDFRDFIATPKVDGGSSVAYYDEGRLVRVLSRGDGEVGLDITQNLIPGKSIPMTISDRSVLAVRGEVAMTLESFEKLGGSHPRNRAVGISQSKSSATDEELQAVKFISYDIIHRQQLPVSKCHDLHHLEELGFTVVPYIKFATWQEFQDAIKEGLNHLSPKLRYVDKLKGHIPVDGIVLTHNTFVSHNVLGDGTYTIDYYSRAYKFKGEEVDTEVIDIAWNMSRTGRLVPVLLVDPVEVSGALITRVTANNAEWIKEMELGAGAKIRIVRSGEVIPCVTEVVEPRTPKVPTHCPDCNSVLVSVDRDLICENPECPKKAITSLYRVFELVKVDGIGDTIIKDVLRQFRIYDFKFFREWLFGINLDSVYLYGQSTTEKFIQMLQRLRTMKVSIEEVLWIANIPRLGKSGSEALGRSVSLQDFLDVVQSTDTPPERWSSHLPTYPAYEFLVENFWRVRQVVEFFGADRIYKKEKKQVRLHVAITGTLSKPRSELEAELSELGITVGSISKNTDYLIANQPSNSSKFAKARSLGIRIVSEEEFKKIIGG